LGFDPLGSLGTSGLDGDAATLSEAVGATEAAGDFGAPPDADTVAFGVVAAALEAGAEVAALETVSDPAGRPIVSEGGADSPFFTGLRRVGFFFSAAITRDAQDKS